jgi:GDPmannose 4,6-dehydratase
MTIKSKRAFITGLYGQDGSYLAEYLLDLGYEVLGLIQESESNHPNSLLFKGNGTVSVHVGDLADMHSYEEVLRKFVPDEIYNLAALSDLTSAGENLARTMRINAWALRDIAEVVYKVRPHARIFQALTSRMLVPHADGSIDEKSACTNGVHPYDVSKRASYEEVVLPYREKGFFIASGFLCNHESPRRGNRFVTGKIAEQVALISQGKVDVLAIGNVDAKRDWSYAGDVVRAMHAILSLSEPSDFVIGSSTTRTVRDFVTEAFKAVGQGLLWKGEGIETKAYDTRGKVRVIVDPTFFREDDNPVVSNTTKLEETTKWKRTITFEEMVHIMVKVELEKITCHQ